MTKRLNKYFGFTLFFYAALFSVITSAAFKDAYLHYKNKEYEEAYYNFKNLAQIGDKASQYSLGVMYYRGEYVSQDAVEAFAWMKLAAEDGKTKYENTATKIYSAFAQKEKIAADSRLQMLMSQYGTKELESLLAPKPLSDEDCEKAPERKGKIKVKYPKSAIKGNRMKFGYVDLIVNISKEGYARDISLRQKTDDMFIQPSVDALIKARWEPKLKDGEPAMYRNSLWRFNFLPGEGGKIFAEQIEKVILSDLEAAKQDDIEAQYKYAKSLETAKSYAALKGKLDLEYQTANEWFLKAARSGHPLAQYELGKNMAAGRGCEVDADAGLKWLMAAATSGHPFAQEEVAMSLIQDKSQDTEQMLYWLRKSTEGNYYKAKLLLAWHLSTLADSELRDPGEAIQLLRAEPSMYYDEVRILETKAAAHAANSEFDLAVDLQEQALDAAKKLRWKIPIMESRLNSYKNKESWVGPYHI